MLSSAFIHLLRVAGTKARSAGAFYSPIRMTIIPVMYGKWLAEYEVYSDSCVFAFYC